MFIEKVGLYASSQNLLGDKSGDHVRVWAAGYETMFLSDKRLGPWDGDTSRDISVSLQHMMSYINSASMEEDVRVNLNRDDDHDFDEEEEEYITDFVYNLRQAVIVGVDDGGNYLTAYPGLRAKEILRRALLHPDRSFTIISSYGFVCASSTARVLVIKTASTEQPVRGDICVGHKFYTPVSFETKDLSFGETIKVEEGDIVLTAGTVSLTTSTPFSVWSNRVIGGTPPAEFTDLQRAEAVGYLTSIATIHKNNEASFIKAEATGTRTITSEDLNEVRRAAAEESSYQTDRLMDFLCLPYGVGGYEGMSSTMREALEAALTRASNLSGGTTRRFIVREFLNRVDEALRLHVPASSEAPSAPSVSAARHSPFAVTSREPGMSSLPRADFSDLFHTYTNNPRSE